MPSSSCACLPSPSPFPDHFSSLPCGPVFGVHYRVYCYLGILLAQTNRKLRSAHQDYLGVTSKELTREEDQRLEDEVSRQRAGPRRPAPRSRPALAPAGRASRAAPRLSPPARGAARRAYEERSLPSGHLDPARLLVLADALEEAGCADADLPGHLRGPGPHVRGCWALDLILGKG